MLSSFLSSLIFLSLSILTLFGDNDGDLFLGVVSLFSFSPIVCGENLTLFCDNGGDLFLGVVCLFSFSPIIVSLFSFSPIKWLLSLLLIQFSDLSSDLFKLTSFSLLGSNSTFEFSGSTFRQQF